MSPVIGRMHAFGIALTLHTETGDFVAGRRARRTHVFGASFGAGEHAAASRGFANGTGSAVLVGPALDAAVKRQITAWRASGAVRVAAACHALMRHHVAMQ